MLSRVADPTDDHLPIFGMFIGAFIHQCFARFLPGSVSPFLVLVPLAWFAASIARGLVAADAMARGLVAADVDAGDADPMYDAEVDEAATTPGAPER
jgi:hypothetical protein